MKLPSHSKQNKPRYFAKHFWPQYYTRFKLLIRQMESRGELNKMLYHVILRASGATKTNADPPEATPNTSVINLQVSF